MADRLPALHLYVLDHLAAIRPLRPFQQALYTQILCYSHLSRRRGHLQQPSGKPIPNDQLAQMTGFSADLVSRLLQELLDAEVISRTSEGIVFVPWIVAAERKRVLCKAAGAKGGNPTLKGPSKGQVKGLSKGEVNRIPEDENVFSSGEEEGEPGEEGGGLRAALIAEFRLMPFAHEELEELRNLVAILTGKAAEPSEIALRAARYRKQWPGMACTPRALVRWWDTFAPAKPAAKEESFAERARRKAQEAEERAWLAMDQDERDRQVAASLEDARRKLGRTR
jgi:hypothetical protein